MSYHLVELGDSPTAYLTGCDPIQVESAAWHSVACLSVQDAGYRHIVCATRPNELGFVPGRFYRVCDCSKCWDDCFCKICNAVEAPDNEDWLRCDHFLMGRFNTTRDSLFSRLYLVGRAWFPDEDTQALMSWPLEMYQRILRGVHLIAVSESDPEQDHFDVDARRLELWTELKAHRSHFMLYLVLAARASGCDLPRDLVRAISDLAWRLPARH